MLPTEMQSALDTTLGRLKSSLGENLYSCVLYGSAVRGNVVAGVSDINLLLVLQQSTPDAHAAIAECIRGKVEIEPFVLGKTGMARSFQSFAIKFRSIQRNYRVLHGADPFSEFKVSDDIVRFLCEQTLRNLRLRTVHAFVTTGDGGVQRYQRHLVAMTPGLFTDLGEALRCGGVEVPVDFAERVPIFEKSFSVDASVLNTLLELKSNRRALSANELKDLHAQVYTVLTQAIAWMESRWPQLDPMTSG